MYVPYTASRLVVEYNEPYLYTKPLWRPVTVDDQYPRPYWKTSEQVAILKKKLLCVSRFPPKHPRRAQRWIERIMTMEFYVQPVYITMNK